MEYPDKYLTNLLEHMSEYDENKISKLIKEEYFIEAMILIHRHIAEQIRHLLVENIEKINKKLVSGNFINIIKKLEDEKERLNFYHFLHTPNYKRQMEALATGTILLDVKEEDLIEKMLIPKNEIDKNYEKMKGFLKVQEDLIK